jgi:two-component system response regulator FixJ
VTLQSSLSSTMTSLSEKHSKGSWEVCISRSQLCSGEEFLQSSELRSVACRLLDVAMPGMSGLEVQQQLQARGLRIPTVFVTAHAVDEVAQHLMAAGAIEILPKPVDQQMLLRLVQSVMGAP